MYTVNEESKHLIIQNIPDIGLGNELEELCKRFGTVEDFKSLSSKDYPPKEPFTTVFYIKYPSIRQARYVVFCLLLCV